MSSIRNSAVALGASLALGAGIAVTAPAASAEAACTTGVRCSMSTAKQVTASKARYGARNSSVRNLQLSLRALGYRQSVTGYYGTQTRGNVRAYQASRGLGVTGTVTSSTLRALTVGAGARKAASTKPAPRTTVRASSTLSRVARGTALRPAPQASSKGQAAVAYAQSKLGRPYVYGATGPNAFDCSGLTQAAWRSVGVSIPRTSYAQYSGLRKVSLSNLQPGDIISFYGGGHVGIYVGNGYVIHAPNSRSVVKKVKMTTMPVRGAVRPA